MFYQHLGFVPVGCCSSCWFSTGVGLLSLYPDSVGRRRSKPAHSVVIVEYVIVGSRQLSRFIDGGLTLIWNLMKVVIHFTRDMSVWILSSVYTNVVSWFSLMANLSGLSLCQCHYVSWLVKSFSPIWNQMMFKDNDVECT